MANIFLSDSSDDESFHGFAEDDNEMDITDRQFAEDSDMDVDSLDSSLNESTTDDEENDEILLTADAEKHFMWSEDFSPMNDKRFREPNAGPQVDIAGLPEVSAFSIFMTDDFLQTICDLTNENYKQKFEENPTKHKMKFPFLILIELKAFLGMLIGFGLVQLRGNIRKYWSTENPLIETPGFKKVFPRDRFVQILRYIHFVDEKKSITINDHPEYDNMYKIRYLFNYLIPRFREAYKPERYLALDESTIPGQCRMPARQFNKSKPDRWGQKVFVVSESSTGYILNAQIYSGKIKKTSDNGATYDTVMSLMVPFYNSWYYVFMDRFYSSPVLYIGLLSNKIFSCGTVMPNRKGLPNEIISKPITSKMKKGDALFRQCLNTGLLAVTWKDTKTVTVISTIPCDFSTEAVQRKVKNKKTKIWSTVNIRRPTIIGVYNKYMGGVDLGNKKIKCYKRKMKGLRWPHKVFTFLLDSVILNSYILFQRSNPESKLTHRDFRIKLCDQLINNNTFRVITASVKENEMRMNRNLNHEPTKLEKSSWCKVHTQRVDTMFACKICEVRMCPVPCFGRYHYMADYKYDDPSRVHKPAARKEKKPKK